MPELITYQCPECGLHYENVDNAKACEEFCKANKACDLEIAKFSLEAQSV